MTLLDHRSLFVEATPDADALCVTVSYSPFTDEERTDRAEAEAASLAALEAFQRGEPALLAALESRQRGEPGSANVREAGTGYASMANVSRAYWSAVAEHATKRVR
jgi:hypothetical protein